MAVTCRSGVASRTNGRAAPVTQPVVGLVVFSSYGLPGLVLKVTDRVALSPSKRFQLLPSPSSLALSENAIGAPALSFVRTVLVRFSFVSSLLSANSTHEAGAGSSQALPRP